MLQSVCKQFCPAIISKIQSEPKTMALNISQDKGLRNTSIRMKPGKGMSKTL